MSARSIKKKSKRPETHTRYARFHAMKDKDIDYSDIPRTTKKFWADAIVLPPGKIADSVWIDNDVAEWFARQGPGFDDRMNAVLRAYMEHQKRKQAKRKSG